MYEVCNIARYVIQRCNSRGKTISNLKLQKILYFIQAEFLVATGSPCFAESIQAWTFGPVVPEVYHKYKVFGGAHIPVDENAAPVVISEGDRKLIDCMVDACAEYTASALVDITHRQAPWKDAYDKGVNTAIDNEEIRKYFSED